MSAKHLQGRTAFIIIHGVGEQSPFETMDYFCRNWIKYFEQQNLNPKLEHLITQRQVSNNYGGIENFVRLSFHDSPQEDSFVDFHEYYWAFQTENKISVSEILEWAQRTLKGTIKFYRHPENKPLLDELLKTHKINTPFKFRWRWFTLLLLIFTLIYPLLRVLVWLILLLSNPLFPGNLSQSPWQRSKTIVTPALVTLIEDIAIYTTTDIKSPYYKIRQQILTESLTFLKAILNDKQANYDQVILVGHSLGSCIAYDTLNLLSIQASVAPDKGKSLLIDKITGLITFGSPLDKIAFFFREIIPKEQYIRTKIFKHLNSFRVRTLGNSSSSSSQYLSKNPVDSRLDNIRWVNYYHLKDPISGHLDYYQNLDNVLMTYPASWGNQGHQGYWTDPSFYEDIAQRFL
ncbi:MAG: hypothetical protein QNJ47_23160 [Nostocaceae cyanobacterium]|nr:hypothetical protein [Nostocaceae cyanobacterium]